MIFRLFRRPSPTASIAALYGTIVAQARAPAFYRDFGVPDTVQGRLELLILHLVLVLQRLEQGGQGSREKGEGEQRDTEWHKLGQGLFDAFCRDVDANLRELGVGDLAVPRKMQELGEAFYGRQAAYRGALSADEPALAQALDRNVFAGRAGAPSAALAAYVRAAVRGLAGQEGFARGDIAFPDPAADRGATAEERS